jgi:V-type H+-transporting ATPase subunit a
MNPQVTAFMRNFVNDVKRCDEMERKLRFLVDQLKRENDFEQLYGEGVLAMQRNGPITLDQLEGRLEIEEQELASANASALLLERNRNELVELKHVLEKDELFFQEAGGAAQAGAFGGDDEDRRPREDAPLLGEVDTGVDEESFFPKAAQSLGYITGVIESSVRAFSKCVFCCVLQFAQNFLAFERVLWRATRGNLYMRRATVDEEIKDLATGDLISKDVFIVFFQGTRVEQKVRRICEAFKANLYPCPENPAERRALVAEVGLRLHEVDTVLRRGNEVRRAVLRRVALEAPAWQQKLRREKAIFNVMNMMDYDHGRKCLIANGWCPVQRTGEIQEALRRGVRRTGGAVPSVLSVLPTDDTPPTHFNTNKFTAVFQEMVDAYGVPHYGEINPAVFSLATFPFLFAVMYGDVGHGLLMLLAIVPMLVWSRQSAELAQGNEIFGMAYSGRYLLLMMAIGAIYTGFIYNEFFSIPMDIFGSKWSHETCTLPNCPYGGCGMARDNSSLCKENATYPFGIDPAFRGAENELNFSNSIKMKMAIIIGVLHMTLGVIMHCVNGIKFRKWYNVFCEFIPQILFLWCLFGYLLIIIFTKWGIDYGYYAPPLNTTCNATTLGGPPPQVTPPSLIGVMISLALPFFNAITCEQEQGLFGPWMGKLQTALLLVAFVCIPWMLALKPILLWRDNRRGVVDKEHGEHFQMGEVFVHQMIHSIEFILGTISNTASYLRLWALSLAHSELSIVFYEKALVGVGFSRAASSTGMGMIMIFVTWGVWAGATIGVLVVMEALSAFLHALRLHWVEFQNKVRSAPLLVFV